MGEIIAFQCIRRTTSLPRAKQLSTTGAQILFFTGIRYERWSEPAPQTPAAATSPIPAPMLTPRPRRKKRQA